MISSRLLSVTPESYPVAIYGSDWIVAKRKRSGLSGAREELWDSLTLPLYPALPENENTQIIANGYESPNT